MNRRIEADLTWTGERFERAVEIVVADDGRIASVGPSTGQGERLANRALLPGFVSAHSHAFQRALRGHGEIFPEGAGSFWSWREAMYALVERLDVTRFYDAVHATFREMLAAGITTAGEFHYLHHSPSGPDFAFDEIVLRAAHDAGIRIVLLLTHYRTGAIGRPLAGAQRRFDSRSLDDFWRQAGALAPGLDLRTQSLGVAAHSIRGVPPEEIALLYAEARRRGLPFHMHIEEQRKEIAETLVAYGKRPMQLLLERLASCEGFTAVHATHSDAGDLNSFVERGGRICITPLTEANLGDGIPPLIGSTAISLGTDSNARISMIEEMRWLEYGQRLRSETRGVFRDEDGRNAPALLRCATQHGAAALGVDAGRIAPGACADFAAIDLTASAIAGIDPQHLLEAIIFGAGNEVVAETWVAGDRRHARTPAGGP